MEVSRYRKKPVEVEAVQWPGGPEAATPIIDWILANGGTARYHEAGERLADPDCENAVYHGTHQYCPTCAFTTDTEHLAIDTLEGTMRTLPGDWIIRGVESEFYSCKPSVFDVTYEQVASGPIDAQVWRGNGRIIRIGDSVRAIHNPAGPADGVVTRIWKASPTGLWRLTLQQTFDGKVVGTSTVFAHTFGTVAR